MGTIVSNIQQIQDINATSLASITGVTNQNFKLISQSLLSFFTKIAYNEDTNAMTLGVPLVGEAT